MADFFSDIRARKVFIILNVLVFMVLGWFISAQIPPLYEAHAYIKLESPESSYDMIGEREILQSSDFIKQVIIQQRLTSDPELNPLLIQKIPSNRQYHTDLTKLGGQFKSLSLPEPVFEEGDNKSIMDEIIHNIRGRLKVRAISQSNIMEIGYTSKVAGNAAHVANAIAKTYLEFHLHKKSIELQKQVALLKAHLSAMRDQAEASLNALDGYQRKHDIRIERGKAFDPFYAPQFLHERDHAPKPIKLAKPVNVPSKDSSSKLVTELNIRLSELQQKLSKLSERYGPKHPTMINLNKEIRFVRSELHRQKAGKAVKQKTQESAMPENPKRSVQENIKDKPVHIPLQKIADLRELFRDLEERELFYREALREYAALNIQNNLGDDDMQILVDAEIPHDPISPNKPYIMGLFAVLGGLFAIAVILFQRQKDRGFRKKTQLEALTGQTCLAMIPGMKKMPPKEMANYILNQPASPLAEMTRTLHVLLKLRTDPLKQEGRGKVVSITSSLPGEGKTTLSVLLGRISATSGEKVILIDCDLRRPSISKILPAKGQKNLVDYLTGQASLDDIIEKDVDTGMHKIYARSVPNTALNLVQSEKMKNLIATLRKVYDVVLIDTPACLAASDAVVLTFLSDYSLYCVNWNKTPRDIVTIGLKTFTDMGYQNMSMVLTNVDMSQHIKYEQGAVPYYYNHYREYYQN